MHLRILWRTSSTCTSGSLFSRQRGYQRNERVTTGLGREWAHCAYDRLRLPITGPNSCRTCFSWCHTTRHQVILSFASCSSDQYARVQVTASPSHSCACGEKVHQEWTFSQSAPVNTWITSRCRWSTMWLLMKRVVSAADELQRQQQRQAETWEIHGFLVIPGSYTCMR